MSLFQLQFIHRHRIVRLDDVPPQRTLLEVLREDLQACDAKEGCNEGDCGACTVVIGEPRDDGIHYKAINGCIRMAHSVHGMAIWTAQDLTQADGTPHPVQAALRDHHATQCGFCTPGFAMSLFALYQNKVCPQQAITPETAQHYLSGNLCRCTGYRPLVDAACSLNDSPVVTPDDVTLRTQLSKIEPRGLSNDNPYLQPHTLAQLLHLRRIYPQAQLIAGGTDVGLWVTKQHKQWLRIIDVTQVRELQNIDTQTTHVRIGAAVTLEQAWATLACERPELKRFWHRFAGLPVRNSGTLGGNIANGSPIGDSMPLLIALHADVVLAREEAGQVVERTMPLEHLYTGYRQNCLLQGEVLAYIDVPRPSANEWLRVYKISKRQEDDISAVCLAIQLKRDAQGVVLDASIGVGGVAATPVRAHQTQACLQGFAWDEARVKVAQQQLQQEFTPVSDMRASASYRSQVLVNLLQRAWYESQDMRCITLETLA
ncbi:xanthine dehydrogenase small subunit [Limnohabitans sp.]|uniref:xanthine dehydrogenase small subunit n=1 Tax=Limnohabitans sp. TaxID=1907725 RepID=UPI00286F65D1|nr:xanthine dehydrogenase small subunit [Limnohabitans sp.]